MAASSSASAKMMFGFLPPSSSETFLKSGAHASATLRPVTVPPVNEIVLRFRFRMQDRSREESEVCDGPRNIERARERNRLASIDRLSTREFLQVAFDQIGDPQQITRTFGCRLVRPIVKSFLRCSDRKIDIVRVTVRHLRIRFASRRFDVVEIFATDRLKKLAVDEIPDASQYFCHNKQRAKRSRDCS